MKMVIVLEARIYRQGKLVYEVISPRAITTSGWNWLRDCLSNVTRPNPIGKLGIGWGPGSTTPFSLTDTALRGTGQSIRTATYVYDPADPLTSRWTVLWDVNDPSTTDTIQVAEIGLFTTDEILIDRTTIAPKPKRPTDKLQVTAAVQFDSKNTLFRFS